MRLRSDFWVAAFIRQCEVDGLVAVLRRRGAAEAGAIYVKLDCLDGRAALFGPAPQSDVADEIARRFIRLHKNDWIDPPDAEMRLAREAKFDSDIWIVELENRQGQAPIEIVDV